jgi:hypothetical protein
MKDDYSVGLKNGINNSNVIWADVARNTEDIVGLQAVWSVHSGRSNATGNRAELGTLPVADRQRYLRAVDDLEFMYHTIQVSGPAKHLTRNDEGAFIRAVEAEVKGAEKDMKLDAARQAFGQRLTVNGTLQSGVIGTLSADPGAGAVFTFANEPASIIRHFHVNMQIGFVNPADGVFRTGVYSVASIQVAARTVTMNETAAAGITTGDMAVRATSATGASGNGQTVSDSNLNVETNGLRFLIGTANYAGITASTNAVWNALTLGSATTAISESILDEAVELVEVEGNGDSPELYVTEQAQRRKLASLLQTQKRYEGREMTLTSGWRGLNVARGSLVVDRYCPSNLVFALKMSEIELFVGLDFQWDDDDGEVFFKSQTQDAINARYKAYLNLEAVTRNAHTVVTLAEPTF